MLGIFDFFQKPFSLLLMQQTPQFDVEASENILSTGLKHLIEFMAKGMLVIQHSRSTIKIFLRDIMEAYLS